MDYHYRKDTTMSKKYTTKQWIDHVGNIFNTQQDMAKYWNVNYHTFRTRQNKGHSLKECLTGRDNTTCCDHLGNTFKSIKDMCNHYGISRDAYNYRTSNNWPLEKILTTKVDERKPILTDHLGNKFTSQRELCEYWNVDQSVFSRAINKGESLENALSKTKQTKIKSNGIIDHNGNKFNTMKEMCKYWNINYILYKTRRRQNIPMKKALLSIDLRDNHLCSAKINDNFIIEHKITDEWYSCIINNNKIILNENALIDKILEYQRIAV